MRLPAFWIKKNPYEIEPSQLFVDQVIASEFLDPDGNSIVGGGGGESIWRFVTEFDNGGSLTLYYPEMFKDCYVLSEEGSTAEGVIGTWADDEISVGKVKALFIGEPGLTGFKGNNIYLETGHDPSAEKPEINCGGPIYSNSNYTVEQTVLGGINITAAEADRPDQLPFSADEKSLQYALSVTHQTLGRTVEIDKDGTIRANAFTDMDGNPIGGGEAPDLTGYATETYVDDSIAAIPPTDLSSYSTTAEADGRYYQKTETKKVVVMTESEYNALGSKDSETVYMLT